MSSGCSRSSFSKDASIKVDDSRISFSWTVKISWSGFMPMVIVTTRIHMLLCVRIVVCMCALYLLKQFALRVKRHRGCEGLRVRARRCEWDNDMCKHRK